MQESITNKKDNAIILVSGGVDSATALAIAVNQGKFNLIPVYVMYGNRAPIEVTASRNICNHYNLPDPIIINAAALRETMITDTNEIPYEAPYRNCMFTIIVAALAVRKDAKYIILGAHMEDEVNGYADSTLSANNAMNTLLEIAKPRQAKHAPQLLRPLADLGYYKKDIIQAGVALNVPYELTVSCYNTPTHEHCGECDACTYRRRAFLDAGVKDPTKYKR